MHSGTGALSRPAQSEVQGELLAHVSGEPVNRVVISLLLFRPSVPFSSKSPAPQGPVFLYFIGHEISGGSYWDAGPLKVTVSPTPPTLQTAHTLTEWHPGGLNKSAACYSVKRETGFTSDCQAPFFSF